MTIIQIYDILHQSMMVLIKVAGPTLMVALVVGVIISLIQALTQIQEATLSFVPKILMVFLSLMFFAPFMVGTLIHFTEETYSKITEVQ
jgi:flagellar biosynthetic protein FliQ